MFIESMTVYKNLYYAYEFSRGNVKLHNKRMLEAENKQEKETKVWVNMGLR